MAAELTAAPFHTAVESLTSQDMSGVPILSD